jgi:site-specific DNA-methyltransferase (adenine-specific)
LDDGGLFVTYYGHVYLNKVIAVLDEYLTYRWIMASAWDGDANMVHPLEVSCQWKPILIYTKGRWKKRPQYWADVLHVNSKEKEWHDWQQPLEEVKRLVTSFTEPGDLIVDPCGGGFTTALACHHLGRPCISCDVDEAAVTKGTERLNRAMRGEPDTP